VLINRRLINQLVNGNRFQLINSFILKPKKDIANEVAEIIKSHEKDIDEYEKVRQHLITKGKEKET